MDLLFELARRRRDPDPDHPRSWRSAERCDRIAAHRRRACWSPTTARTAELRPTCRNCDGKPMNLAFRLARREMRSGLGGFRLFIACLALGVGGDRRHPVLQPRRRGGPARRRPRDPGRRRRGVAALSRGYARADRLAWASRASSTRWIDSRAMARPVKPDGRSDAGPAQGGRARLSALWHGRAPGRRDARRCAGRDATACGARRSRNRRCAA